MLLATTRIIAFPRTGRAMHQGQTAAVGELQAGSSGPGAVQARQREALTSAE
ncbi:hypothetical protein KTAU_09710 [Thermogemmatispora aurantia]|uniref:Uncharacterized protein n=1 Tax=Thermogemmatispora aurantia TaxID=2045279 RepID=A0A5J4K4B1_9CHLR|nr:hypothetical protein KTAU_09710 [Thermogemmatispora aurantia]